MNSDKPQEENEPGDFVIPERTLARKFLDASRGIKVAIRGEINFFVHLFVTAVVVVAGLAIGISRIEWCVVILCVGVALSAEMLNASIECMARAVTRQYHPEIRDALDIAAGAVLLIAFMAIVLGLMIIGYNAWQMLV